MFKLNDDLHASLGFLTTNAFSWPASRHQWNQVKMTIGENAWTWCLGSHTSKHFNACIAWWRVIFSLILKNVPTPNFSSMIKKWSSKMVGTIHPNQQFEIALWNAGWWPMRVADLDRWSTSGGPALLTKWGEADLGCPCNHWPSNFQTIVRKNRDGLQTITWPCMSFIGPIYDGPRWDDGTKRHARWW